MLFKIQAKLRVAFGVWGLGFGVLRLVFCIVEKHGGVVGQAAVLQRAQAAASAPRNHQVETQFSSTKNVEKKACPFVTTCPPPLTFLILSTQDSHLISSPMKGLRRQRITQSTKQLKFSSKPLKPQPPPPLTCAPLALTCSSTPSCRHPLPVCTRS